MSAELLTPSPHKDTLEVGEHMDCAGVSMLNRANWSGSSSVSLLFVVVLSLSLLFVGLDRAQNTKVLKCIRTANQQKHLDSHIEQNNVHDHSLFDTKQDMPFEAG